MSRFADPDNLHFPECPRRHLTSAPNSDLCPRRSDPERTDRTAVGRQCSAINGNHFAIELSSATPAAPRGARQLHSTWNWTEIKRESTLGVPFPGYYLINALICF